MDLPTDVVAGSAFGADQNDAGGLAWFSLEGHLKALVVTADGAGSKFALDPDGPNRFGYGHCSLMLSIYLILDGFHLEATLRA